MSHDEARSKVCAITLINGVTKLPEKIIKQKKKICHQLFFPNGICLMGLYLVNQIKKGNTISNFGQIDIMISLWIKMVIKDVQS